MPAGSHFKTSLWDAVKGDEYEAPEVEPVEAHTKRPSGPLEELPSLPPLVGVAWQDQEDMWADQRQMSYMSERHHFIASPTDSRPQSRISTLDDPIFDGLKPGVLDDCFNHLPREPKDPFDDPLASKDGGLNIPTPPASTQKSGERTMMRRKLPPVSLEAAEAAVDAAIHDLAPSARGGSVAEAATVAPPSIKHAWVTPEQPQAPPPANRFMRPAFRRPLPMEADAESSPEASSSETKLSL